MNEGVAQDRKIKCPHCGWVRRIPAKALAEEDAAGVTLGVREGVRELGRRIRDALKARRAGGDAWLEMPACPNPDCGKPYRYNAQTGVVQR